MNPKLLDAVHKVTEAVGTVYGVRDLGRGYYAVTTAYGQVTEPMTEAETLSWCDRRIALENDDAMFDDGDGA
jgi:hypothetical protein